MCSHSLRGKLLITGDHHAPAAIISMVESTRTSTPVLTCDAPMWVQLSYVWVQLSYDWAGLRRCQQMLITVAYHRDLCVCPSRKAPGP